MIGGSAYVGAMAVALTAGAVTFPAIISAAVLGGIGGGTMGAILSKILGDRYTRYMEAQIEKGGLLLWVRADTTYKIETAKQIMVANNGYDVHVQKRD
jgi:outer membrane lipoprotein SlyB